MDDLLNVKEMPLGRTRGISYYGLKDEGLKALAQDVPFLALFHCFKALPLFYPRDGIDGKSYYKEKDEFINRT